MSVFYLCGDVYKFTRDHATLKFYKPSWVFCVTSTYYKTTTDYMKYSSKMAKNRVCEILNSVLKNKLNKHATEQSEKLSDLKKYSQGSLKKINTFGQKLALPKSLPALDVALLSLSLAPSFPKGKFTKTSLNVVLVVVLTWTFAKEPASFSRILSPKSIDTESISCSLLN